MQRKLYVSMIVSLDGYIEGPDRSLAWFTDVPLPAFEQYCSEMVDGVDLAIYGRRSYELMIQYWPQATGDFARRMNALPKVVLSRTLETATWNTTIARDTDAIAALKQQPGRPIVAWAGASLVASLLAANLVDELRLVVFPAVLGSGTRLFDAPLAVRQIRAQALSGGVSVLCYEPVR
jgi:dihydrofolate reductase